MATIDQMNEDEAAYSAAFNEDQQPSAGPTEDEEFGTGELPQEPSADETSVNSEDAGNASEGKAPAVAIVVDGEGVEEEMQAAGAKDSATVAADQDPVVAIEDEPAKQPADMDKEVQRLKSWEGRLKAMEAKLKAAGADTPAEQAEAVSEAIETSADATDTPADGEMVEQIAEQVEDGQMSVDQAMKQLADDFGDEFVKMIEAIATAKAKEAGGAAASEKMGELSKTVDEIIGDIVDTKAKNHFETIADAHPDFNEVGDSEEFKTFIESLPDQKKEEALRVVANGSAKQIVRLLNDFKASAPAAKSEELTQASESIVDEFGDAAMDAAEGVRSSGMKLPVQPAKSDDYASAWDEFN
jgi:hypothetical protein